MDFECLLDLMPSYSMPCPADDAQNVMQSFGSSIQLSMISVTFVAMTCGIGLALVGGVPKNDGAKKEGKLGWARIYASILCSVRIAEVVQVILSLVLTFATFASFTETFGPCLEKFGSSNGVGRDCGARAARHPELDRDRLD